jgi:hypothetical protein
MNFAEVFCALTEKRPFPWQERAFKQLSEGNPPKTLKLHIRDMRESPEIGFPELNRSGLVEA